METFQPLVSIGMPVYNGADHLREALDSLLAQTQKKFELIISDNASNDLTTQICSEYTKKDSRIRYYRQTTTLAAENNFNFVLEKAQAEFFMWAAHDDLWEPTFIEQMLKLLQLDAGAALAFCAFRSFSTSTGLNVIYRHHFDLPSPNLFRRLWRYLMQKEKYGKANPIYGLMRRGTILSVGGFQHWGESRRHADMLMVFHLLSLGNMALSRELLFHKRMSETDTKPYIAKSSLTAAEMRLKIQNSIGYLKGYTRILRMIPELKKREYFLLRLGLAWRVVCVYWRENWQWFSRSILHLTGLRKNVRKS